MKASVVCSKKLKPENSIFFLHFFNCVTKSKYYYQTRIKMQNLYESEQGQNKKISILRNQVFNSIYL